MSTWLTEAEYRTSGAAKLGLTLNTAFLQEIKEDHIEFRKLLEDVLVAFSQKDPPTPKQAVDWLSRLRDALESYFALEEFYGYFKSSRTANLAVSQRADKLRHEHHTLFVRLCELEDQAEQILYHETPITMAEVAEGLIAFYSQMREHEQREMALMMELHNQVLGGGD
ncbi:MAG TPA: hemerythrin domain-containing protein [Pirellulaceae bacterium]|nr:hemerythrin domain-containing protein [Pirellulaceae bacterium]